MITSSSIPYISQMLNDPHSITDADIDSIVSLTETYPYFVPARYMEAASQHKHQPFNADMMNTMQLYMGNWIVFHQYMQTAYGGEYVEEVRVNAEPADVDEDATEQEEIFADTDSSIWSQDEDEDEDGNEEVLTLADDEEHAVAVEAMDVEEELIEDELTVADEEEYEDDYLDDEEETYVADIETDLEEEIILAEAEPEHIPATAATEEESNEENLILPIYTEDYFLHQGIQVSNNIPETPKSEHIEADQAAEVAPGPLMRVMSYSEWLMHFKTHGEKAREEEHDQKALKTMWQKEKLAAAIEEENEEIPENVFEMAVNSITREEGMASETLAAIYANQGKYDAAIDMYKKLSLRNPQKSAYFARKVEEILKEK